ncbi:MAG: PqqD family protein [Selenomonas sp.]|nr:PqqD family protein [Selenomonas sp.]
MRIKNGFVLRQVCGENVIVGEGLGAINFGKMLALNETAAWLWQQAVAMSDFTVDALAQKLCDEYEVSLDEAKTDVTAIIAEWQQVGVLE